LTALAEDAYNTMLGAVMKWATHNTQPYYSTTIEYNAEYEYVA